MKKPELKAMLLELMSDPELAQAIVVGARETLNRHRAALHAEEQRRRAAAQASALAARERAREALEVAHDQEGSRMFGRDLSPGEPFRITPQGYPVRPSLAELEREQRSCEAEEAARFAARMNKVKPRPPA